MLLVKINIINHLKFKNLVLKCLSNKFQKSENVIFNKHHDKFKQVIRIVSKSYDRIVLYNTIPNNPLFYLNSLSIYYKTCNLLRIILYPTP